ncbi:SDR family NAD(P)-dependent oxidoreductase [Streptomyces albus]|uniref:SDR family NAD(P)-dependent oxidoreductase n=1 Tax=Streptomyces albus TaxID=1888 RepID=UPI0007E4E065|nr:SDR family NAD(P)-dependent oxidoreductase [Streptomyces albus]
MGKLDGRVFVISGAARGQGAEEARLFVSEGAKVVLGDVLVEQGERVAAGLGGDVACCVRLDVREEADWQAAARVAVERFGKVGGLVNNAGILRFNALADTPVAEFREVVDVNQTGCFLGMKTLAPYIERAGGGTIVNTSSYAGLTGMTFLTAYAASKAAVVGMTRVAALELAGRGVRVNAVCPGAIDTPMTNPAAMDAFYAKLVPQGRMGRPEEVARLVLFLSCADSSYVTGQPFVVDGGWLAGVSVV